MVSSICFTCTIPSCIHSPKYDAFLLHRFKGSEMERRRGSILRVEEVKGSGVYVENCPTTVEGCQVWKPYKKMNRDTGVDDWNDQVEICEDRLFDVEDYNRYLVAQVANPLDQEFGDPPLLLNEDNAPDIWYVNPQFDLALLPDSGVTLVHTDLSAWLFGPLVTLNSLSLSIVVNTIKPEDQSYKANQTLWEDIFQLLEDGDNDTAAELYLNESEVIDEIIKENKLKQSIVITIELEMTALFFVNFRAAGLLRNNPRGNDDYNGNDLCCVFLLYRRVIFSPPHYIKLSSTTTITTTPVNRVGTCRTGQVKR